VGPVSDGVRLEPVADIKPPACSRPVAPPVSTTPCLTGTATRKEKRRWVTPGASEAVPARLVPARRAPARREVRLALTPTASPSLWTNQHPTPPATRRTAPKAGDPKRPAPWQDCPRAEYTRGSGPTARWAAAHPPGGSSLTVQGARPSRIQSGIGVLVLV